MRMVSSLVICRCVSVVVLLAHGTMCPGKAGLDVSPHSLAEGRIPKITLWSLFLKVCGFRGAELAVVK